jgi:hypothetical protein
VYIFLCQVAGNEIKEIDRSTNEYWNFNIILTLQFENNVLLSLRLKYKIVINRLRVLKGTGTVQLIIIENDV